MLVCREGVAQAAAEEAALLKPPSPPPEPVTASARSPQRSRRAPAPAQQTARKTPKKSTDAALPKRKSEAAAPAAGQQQQKLASKGAADAPGAVDGNVSGGDGAVDAASATAGNTTDDGTPAELSAAIAAWQQFEEQAKALLVGRKQADNMVQLLLSQVEGKQPEQVTMEVVVALIAFLHAGWLSVSLLHLQWNSWFTALHFSAAQVALLHPCCSLLWRAAHGDKFVAPTLYKATAACTMPVATANRLTCCGASPVARY